MVVEQKRPVCHQRFILKVENFTARISQDSVRSEKHLLKCQFSNLWSHVKLRRERTGCQTVGKGRLNYGRGVSRPKLGPAHHLFEEASSNRRGRGERAHAVLPIFARKEKNEL